MKIILLLPNLKEGEKKIISKNKSVNKNTPHVRNLIKYKILQPVLPYLQGVCPLLSKYSRYIVPND